MPYETRRVPPPRNPGLPVLAKLPGPEGPPRATPGPREARAGGKDYHYCARCKGWVEGHPSAAPVSRMAPVAGRLGVEYSCRRCGHEVAFVGMRS